jgi:hypothetical protein
MYNSPIQKRFQKRGFLRKHVRLAILKRGLYGITFKIAFMGYPRPWNLQQ